ncbi:MAG: dihydrodipicolinate reductase [Burkholderiales bacterium]|jgi:4-hydroxy-tetrahydrodipicolinate reductase|nr:dihydrodipicolinate reductase [Burkholderiales bacterium]
MKKIRTGLFGFGKAGKFVASELLENELFDLAWVVKRSQMRRIQYASQAFHLDEDRAAIYREQDLSPEFFAKNEVDLIIDFSGVNGYKGYAPAAAQGVKIVSAISSYSGKALAALRAYSAKTAVLYSPNITLGINFLMIASVLLQKIAPHADIEIIEEHFREKEDTSGTALKIAKALGLDTEKRVNSIRVGGIVGKHEVIFGLKNQTIRLVHESISKAAFGQGAIFAAKWLMDKPNGFYTMEEAIIGLIRENMPVGRDVSSKSK